MKTQQRGWNVGLQSLLWHPAQIGQRNCQHYTPAALYAQGSILLEVKWNPGLWNADKRNRSHENLQGPYQDWTWNLLFVAQCLKPLCHHPPTLTQKSQLLVGKNGGTKQQWWTGVTGTYAPFSIKVFKLTEESYVSILWHRCDFKNPYVVIMYNSGLVKWLPVESVHRDKNCELGSSSIGTSMAFILLSNIS